jgi:peptidoglycan hydrolase-like protein with peptidoglycan-binding domain
MTILQKTVLASAIALLGGGVARAQSQNSEPPTMAPNAQPPRGEPGKSTETASASHAARLSAQDSVALSEMSEAAARAIQTKLQTLGLYEGEIDGVVGPQTRRALRAFYNAQAELVSQGKLLMDSAATFKASAAEMEPVRGKEAAAPAQPAHHDAMPGAGAAPINPPAVPDVAPSPGANQPQRRQPQQNNTTIAPTVQPNPGPNATISPTPTTTTPSPTMPTP